MSLVRVCPHCGGTRLAQFRYCTCGKVRAEQREKSRSQEETLGERLPGPGFFLRHRLHTMTVARFGAACCKRLITERLIDHRGTFHRPMLPTTQAIRLIQHDRRITLHHALRGTRGRRTMAPESMTNAALIPSSYRMWVRILAKVRAQHGRAA